MLIALWLFAVQEDASRLVEKLRSDSIEERDDAVRKLKSLGKAAESELKKASEDPDADVAHLSKYLLRILECTERLSGPLRKAYPDLAEQLARDDHHAAAVVLPEAERRNAARRDLEFLAPIAVRGARGEREKLQVLSVVASGRIVSVAEPLLDWFGDRSDAVRINTVQVLIHLNATRECDRLRERLRSEDRNQRLCAAMTLGALRWTAAGPDLLPLLDESDLAVRANAMNALGHLREPAALAPLQRLLTDEDPYVRGLAVEALSLYGDSAPILPLLRDGDPRVRQAALQAIYWLEDRAALPRVRAALLDPDEDVVIQAVSVLSDLGVKEAASDLLVLLRHASADVRRIAAGALKDLDARATAPEVRKLLEDADVRVRIAAIEAVAGLQDCGAISRLARLLQEDAERDVRSMAEDALRRFRGKEAVSALRALLADRNAEVRRAALYALAEGAGADAAPSALECLSDPEEDVRSAALDILGDLDYCEGVPQILKLLEDPGLASDAIRVLARFGRVEVLPKILPFLEHDRAEVRRASIGAVKQLDGGEHLSRIVARLADPDPGVRRAAIEALGLFRAYEHVASIAKLLDDPDPEVRGSAVWILAEFQAPEALPALQAFARGDPVHHRRLAVAVLARQKPGIETAIEALDDPDPTVRWVAIVNLRDPRAVPMLLGMLDDLDARHEVVETLGWIAGKEEIGRLEPLLRDDAPAVRSRVIRAIARIDGASALTPAREGLKDEDPWVVRAALEVLGDFGTATDSARVRAFLGHSDETLRAAAVQALAYLGSDDPGKEIRALLDDPESGVRASAAQALADLGRFDAVPDLRAMLGDGGHDARRGAILALADLGAGDAIDDLIRLVEDSGGDDELRRCAIQALGRMKARPALPTLRKTVRDRNEDLRRAAAEALGRIGERGSASDLRGLLRDRDRDVRAAAASALARLGSREGVDVLLRAPGWVPLAELNQLRRPEACDRLRAKTLSSRLAGSPESIWSELEREFGVKVERPADLHLARMHVRWRRVAGVSNLFDALAETSGGWEFVVESDRIRVMRRADARKLWIDWAAGR